MPESCVARELAEELDLQVAVGPLLDDHRRAIAAWFASAVRSA
jgi:hypothetical protein